MVSNQRCFRTLPEVQKRKVKKKPGGVRQESGKGLLDWVDTEETPGRVPQRLRIKILKILDDILSSKTSEEASATS